MRIFDKCIVVIQILGVIILIISLWIVKYEPEILDPDPILNMSDTAATRSKDDAPWNKYSEEDIINNKAKELKYYE